MKRKRSQETLVPLLQKRTANRRTKKTGGKPCRLLKILGQYGLLASIAGNLLPRDLFALAATSKSTYETIFPCKESRTNLFAKMACAGRGVALRRLHHQKSIYFTQYKCEEYAQCQAESHTETSKSKPCEVCLQTTCDECRIHCVYGSIQQPAEATDELPELSGFALLAPEEMRLLTPAHMGLTTVASTMPCHDQGFLDIPIESTEDAKVEYIDDILDFDLGRGALRLSNSSTASHPSPVIQAFWDVTENRKRRICAECYEETRSRQNITGPPHSCCCTLRTVFVDRWLCLPCYQAEQRNLQATFPTSRKWCGIRCQPCGTSLQKSASCLMCLWCWGIVADPTLEDGTPLV
ncbi:unnamed protein product [Periconia digitata]|uniref:Uncharacterized protein n=1 Tax=Periconia digitata TaxID=1303443 RepID=A0A9W4XVE5_9PLEO|nr:unnamed protein product [Periconia digitata]